MGVIGAVFGGGLLVVVPPGPEMDARLSRMPTTPSSWLRSLPLFQGSSIGRSS